LSAGMPMISRDAAARVDNQAAIRAAREGRESALNLGSVALVERGHLHFKRWRHSLNDAELGGARRNKRPMRLKGRSSWHNSENLVSRHRGDCGGTDRVGSAWSLAGDPELEFFLFSCGAIPSFAAIFIECRSKLFHGRD
jgi:hypothetical protein